MMSSGGCSPEKVGAKQAAKTWHGQKGVGKRSLYLRSFNDSPESVTLITYGHDFIMDSIYTTKPP